MLMMLPEVAEISNRSVADDDSAAWGRWGFKAGVADAHDAAWSRWGLKARSG